jgi:hypothetical protein
MVKSKTIFVALLMLILGILAVTYLFPSEEKRVRRQFDHLAKWVSKGPGESPITMAQKLQNLGTLFDQSCQLTMPVEFMSGTLTPQEITSYTAQGRAAFVDLTLKFYDVSIRFPEKGAASVTLTASLKGKTAVGDLVNETREVQCVLKKVDKKWLFSEVEVVEVLKK